MSALEHSLKLGAVAFVLVVPLGIAGGVWSALHAGRLIDRLIGLIGLSATILPEFVTGIVLIMVFGIWLKILPIAANWPPGAGLISQIHYLLLPSLPLVLVLFGYLAKMARAGTIEALAADYTRTAVLKGLKPRTVLWQPRLEECALADDHGDRHPAGLPRGRARRRRDSVPLSRASGASYRAARDRDFPMLEAGVLIVGVIYTAERICLADGHCYHALRLGSAAFVLRGGLEYERLRWRPLAAALGHLRPPARPSSRSG